MECAPRQGAVGSARPGLPELESRSGGRKGTGPTGGARLSAGAGEGAPTGPGWGKILGRRWSLVRGERRKRKEEGGGLGQKRYGRRERFSLFFNKEIQTIQFKFIIQENSNSNWTTNNKTMYFSMNATQTKQPHLI